VKLRIRPAWPQLIGPVGALAALCTWPDAEKHLPDTPIVIPDPGFLQIPLLVHTDATQHLAGLRHKLSVLVTQTPLALLVSQCSIGAECPNLLLKAIVEQATVAIVGAHIALPSRAGNIHTY